jgi:hypothetical protein
VAADLVDASLATVADDADGEPRIGMLVTVAAFARDRLDAAGELDAARTAHLLHFLGLISARRRDLFVGDMSTLTWFQDDIDNVRAAYAWVVGLAADDRFRDGAGRWADLALGADTALYFLTGGYYADNLQGLQALLDGRDHADSAELVHCLVNLHDALHAAGDETGAYASAARAVDVARRIGDPLSLARGLRGLAESTAALQDHAAAAAIIAEAVAASRSADEPLAVYSTLDFAMELAIEAGRLDDALELSTQLVAAADGVFDEAGLGSLTARLGRAAVTRLRGQPWQAAQELAPLVMESLRYLPDAVLLPAAESLAACFSALEDHARALRIIGAVDARRTKLGLVRAPRDQAVVDAILIAAKDTVADEVDGFLLRGRESSLVEALAEARSALGREPDPGLSMS